MRLKKVFSVALLCLFLSSTALGRPCPSCLPSPTERLPAPIALASGLTITEWRGSPVSKKEIERINVIIEKAKAYFPEFIEGHKFQAQPKPISDWTISLIPNSKERGLKDALRFTSFTLVEGALGYTVEEEKLLAIQADTESYYFSNTVAHEVFHMLFAEWVKDTVPLSREEWLAHKFTSECMARIPYQYH